MGNISNKACPCYHVLWQPRTCPWSWTRFPLSFLFQHGSARNTAWSPNSTYWYSCCFVWLTRKPDHEFWLRDPHLKTKAKHQCVWKGTPFSPNSMGPLTPHSLALLRRERWERRAPPDTAESNRCPPRYTDPPSLHSRPCYATSWSPPPVPSPRTSTHFRRRWGNSYSRSCRTSPYIRHRRFARTAWTPLDLHCFNTQHYSVMQHIKSGIRVFKWCLPGQLQAGINPTYVRWI